MFHMASVWFTRKVASIYMRLRFFGYTALCIADQPYSEIRNVAEVCCSQRVRCTGEILKFWEGLSFQLKYKFPTLSILSILIGNNSQKKDAAPHSRYNKKRNSLKSTRAIYIYITQALAFPCHQPRRHPAGEYISGLGAIHAHIRSDVYK